MNAVERRPRPKYSELVYNGFWFWPEREALQALVTETQRDVLRVVRLKLYKGNIIVAGRKSPKSLYNSKIATIGRRCIIIRPNRRHRIHSSERAAIEAPLSARRRSVKCE